MRKTNLFIKNLKIISNLINNLLEKNLNKLKLSNLVNIAKSNKIILTFVALFILYVSYLLIPTFYNQTEISEKLKVELSEKLKLNFNFLNRLQYSFFPRPHFVSNNAKLSIRENNTSRIGELKIYFTSDNLFSVNNIEVNNVVLKKANFNFDKTNYNFFIKILENNILDKTLKIINSNIFFRNSEKEVLFINKILEMKYYYDSNELKNIIYSKNKIFNVPYELKMFKDKDNKKIISNLSLETLNLEIYNEYKYKDEVKVGKAELNLNKLKITNNYETSKNFFKFEMFDSLDNPDFFYKGKLNFNPFYSSLNANIRQFNLFYALDINSLIVQLLKSEQLNHKNIDFKLILNAKNIYNNINIKNIKLLSKIQDGLIDIDSSEFVWKDYAGFKIEDSLIFVKNGELYLDGKLFIDIKKHNEIYKYLLTPKNFRKKIKRVDLNFSFNFDQKSTTLSEIRIDGKLNQNISLIMNKLIINDNNLQNKIYLKKLLNKAIKIYAG